MMGLKPRQRPWGWWKSGKVLFGVWLGGSLLISFTAMALLYPSHLHLEQLEEKRAEAQKFLADHADWLDPGYERPLEPDEDERTSLQRQVPLEAEPARFLLQLKEAVDASGGEWVELRTGLKSTDLKPLEWPVEAVQEVDLEEEDLSDTEAESEEEREAQEETKSEPESDPVPAERKREEETEEEQVLVPALPEDSALEPLWADLYVRASRQEMLSLLRELEQMERLVAVQGLAFEEGEGERGNLKIRLAWFFYQDPRLEKMTDSLPLLPPEVDVELDEDGREVVPDREESFDSDPSETEAQDEQPESAP